MAEITAVKSWADHNRAWMELLVEKIRVCSCSALLSPCYNMWLWRQINYRKPCFKILQIFHFTCSKLQLWLSCRTYFFKYACVMISGELCKSLEHHKKVRRSAFYFFLLLLLFLLKTYDVQEFCKLWCIVLKKSDLILLPLFLISNSKSIFIVDRNRNAKDYTN